MNRRPEERFTILYDHPQEAEWFRRLHPHVENAAEHSITSVRGMPALAGVLAYDRPDIILLSNGIPILVVEETVEVPSGHNVGQRFARIAAAAECGVPSLYFGPYVAKKHGGDTAGRRFMNLRLFRSLELLEQATGSVVTTINWPVDDQYEVRRDPAKDGDVREYMSSFLSALYETEALEPLNAAMRRSAFQQRMLDERNHFAQASIRNPGRYDEPPESVQLMPRRLFVTRFGLQNKVPGHVEEVVLYRVGMTNIRADPYTGMAILYKYLYSTASPQRALVLWFPNITVKMWQAAAANATRKDIRLFSQMADGIAFGDGFLAQAW